MLSKNIILSLCSTHLSSAPPYYSTSESLFWILPCHWEISTFALVKTSKMLNFHCIRIRFYCLTDFYVEILGENWNIFFFHQNLTTFVIFICFIQKLNKMNLMLKSKMRIDYIFLTLELYHIHSFRSKT